MIFNAQIRDGKLEWLSFPLFSKWLSFQKSGLYTVNIKRYHKPRTEQQNRYYWGVVVPLIAEWVGEEDREDIHETLKSMFNIDRTKKVSIVKSTTRLTTQEFTDYVERVVIWAAKQGVVIPDPEKE